MLSTLEPPEDIAYGLETKWTDLPRAALESLAIEAYTFTLSRRFNAAFFLACSKIPASCSFGHSFNLKRKSSYGAKK
jgi:hypothetical protein